MPLDSPYCGAGYLIRQVRYHVGRIRRPVNIQGVGTNHFEAPLSISKNALQVGHGLLVNLKGSHRGSGPQQSQRQ